MEAFSLLKYWRNSGGGSSSSVGVGNNGGGGASIDGGNGMSTTKSATTNTTTIATTVREMVSTASATTAVETDEDDGDEGPFFDLEFSVPDEEEENQNDEEDREMDQSREEDDDDEGESVGGGGGGGTDGEEEEEEEEEEEGEFNFTVSPDSNGGGGGDGGTDMNNNNVTFSPSDDLFFKGRLVPVPLDDEPSSSSSSILFHQPDSNKPPQFPVSLLKTATKFRVFMLGFKKTKSGTETINGGCYTSPEASSNQTPPAQTQEQQHQQQQQKQSKFFEVKFKVEEVPIISLFTRDNSSKNSSNNKINNKQSSTSSDEINVLEEKKFSKEIVQKYLKMIKPLYVRVSKRYGEKMGFSGQLSLGSGKTAPPTPITSKIDGETEESEKLKINEKNVNQKQGNLPAGFRVVRKHLGKSRSASSAVAAVTPVTIQAKRRDDSLLQQQDGIQSAILHCKRSFNASRESDSCSLSRSTSDSSMGKSIDVSRTSFDEVIEARI